jgi:hypothetical protein
MATKTLIPDCSHCRWLRGELPKPFICTRHQMKLAYPIRAFCADFDAPNYPDWLDNRDQFDPTMMHVWLETVTRNAGGEIERHFDAQSLAPLTEYRNWTRKQFLDAARLLSVQKQAEYRRQGYQIEWME